MSQYDTEYAQNIKYRQTVVCIGRDGTCMGL